MSQTSKHLTPYTFRKDYLVESRNKVRSPLRTFDEKLGTCGAQVNIREMFPYLELDSLEFWPEVMEKKI